MPAETPTAIRLTPDDAVRYCAIRAEMLADSPWSYFSSPGDDRAEDPAHVRERLASETMATFATAQGDRLLSVATVLRSERVRNAHRADIVGVYTTPPARRQGHALSVLRACIDHAKRWPTIDVIGLSVSDRAPGALAAYESLGFVRWGTEPDAMRIGSESASEHHMLLRF